MNNSSSLLLFYKDIQCIIIANKNSYIRYWRGSNLKPYKKVHKIILHLKFDVNANLVFQQATSFLYEENGLDIKYYKPLYRLAYPRYGPGF